MDRFGSALGAALRAPVGVRTPTLYAPPPVQSFGASLARQVPTPTIASYGTAAGVTTGTRMPSLLEPATAVLGSRLAERTRNPASLFFEKHSPTVGLGSSVREALAGLRSPLSGGGASLGGGFGQVGAPAQPTGSSFAGGNLDSATDAINRAAAKYGIPANFLKTIIAAESSGNWERNNWVSYNRPASGRLMPYIGVYENAADSWGVGDLFDQAFGNRDAQIEVLAGVLRGQYDHIRQQNPNYNWLNVASYHYSGRPVPDGWTDEFQNLSNNTYYNNIQNWWGRLEPGFNPNGSGSISAAGSSLGGSGWGGGDAISTMLGGSQPRITQEFGLTDFARGHLNGMYSYATAYGGQGHVGLDIGLNPGTSLRAPVGGTVITAGGSGYYRDDRYGNAPGTGELKIKLDNGDEVILGHMQSIGVRVGQRVTAGQVVGLSGTANGGHVHLEYRQYTPGKTSSGYTAIDPRQVLGSGMGGFGGGFGQPVAPLGSSISDASRLVWDSAFRNQYR